MGRFQGWRNSGDSSSSVEGRQGGFQAAGSKGLILVLRPLWSWVEGGLWGDGGVLRGPTALTLAP